MVTARSSNAEDYPSLESGDHLTVREFERRYAAMPGLKKAELIEGVVFLASPVSFEHSRGHNTLSTWLGTYVSRHPGISAHNDGSVRLDPDNQLQPDIFLRRADSSRSAVGENDLLDGPPELVVEVAVSSVSRDLFAKKHVYRRSGVQEYVVWRVRDRELDWFELVEGEYVLRTPGSDGIIESSQFPGLRLDVGALREGDVARVLAALR